MYRVFIVFNLKRCIKELRFPGLKLDIVHFHVDKLQLPSKNANTTAQNVTINI